MKKAARLAAIQDVISRDGHCVECHGYVGLELHHIVPRSHFGRKNKAECWTPRNMLMLCPDCHRLKDKQAGAHTHEARVRHIALLAERYGYDYSERPWSE